MVDFEPHKVIEDMLPESGIGPAAMVFYIWFASRFPRGATFDQIKDAYGVGRRQTFRYLEKISDLDLVKRKRSEVSGKMHYTPNL